MAVKPATSPAPLPRRSTRTAEADPLWYKDAIIYEVHVRAFGDSDGDGIGDFPGLTARLDYLRDLGITAIWILPFYPSPLRDDGYDIADYDNVHPSYGTLDDFQTFLNEAHRRGLRVITELVINHTSDQHPWFQRARRAPKGSPERDFYVWSDDPRRYREARIIFKDFEHSNWTWDPAAQAYFWHRFYAHQPDLNFDNPAVHEAVFQAMDFWFEMGVDGLRLDAIPYLYEREGTNCENLPETHAFLKKLRARVDARYPGRMLLAEANQWPEDSVAYFGNGDECHTAFHFPVMPRMFMAIRMEDRFPVLDILAQTPAIPETCQWALFLRNHDELTLEMVTDEERDYMYRVYAHDPQARINLGIRRRLAPLLNNNRRRIELMNGLLFSLPGTPVLYYGDEIGMGDNIYLGDRNGVRTPMQWSADRNAGFSRASPQRLYLPINVEPEYHYEALNVEAQQNNPHSLFWWTKRLIALRKRYRAFSRGALEFLHPDNPSILAFVRRYMRAENAPEEIVLVVANTSRFVQHASLDLSAFRGAAPVELFGRNAFPAIGDQPYVLTLGPHAFYWFALEPERQPDAYGASSAEMMPPPLAVDGSWENVFSDGARQGLQDILIRFLRNRRWFGGKARKINTAEILDHVPIRLGSGAAHLALVRVAYADGDPEIYVLPLAVAGGDRAQQLRENRPGAVIASVDAAEGDEDTEGVLYDAMADEDFVSVLFETTTGGGRLPGQVGAIQAWAAPAVRDARAANGVPLVPSLASAEQSNTSVVFGDRYILKLFRRPSEGINPDLELGRFLTERAAFAHTPPTLGSIEYRAGRAEPMTLAILQAYVPNEGDAWQYTRRHLSQYFEQILTHPGELKEAPILPGLPLALSGQAIPELAEETIGPYLETARLLGERTAELHVALASDSLDPAVAPEPFSTLYLRALYQSMRGQARRALWLLTKRRNDLPGTLGDMAEKVLASEADILQVFWAVVERKVEATRIRCHGDLHLGQVLYTGKDFVFIDFEGEPARPIGERRIKRSPLKDVAGMLRSFDYAAQTGLVDALASGVAQPDDLARLEPWAHYWSSWVAATYLKAYFATAGEASFLPRDPVGQETLLQAHVLEKAVYELAYELNNRPAWVKIPLSGILQLLEAR